MLPLALGWLLANRSILVDHIFDIRSQFRDGVSQLRSKSRKQRRRLVAQLPCSGEKETSSQQLPFVKSLCYRAADSGLARACHSTEPEYAVFIALQAPVLDIFQDLRSCVLKACCGWYSKRWIKGVESGEFGNGKF